MKKIRALLYKTPWKLKKKYFFNWLISIRSLSKYSHIEIWTGETYGVASGQVFDLCDGGGNFMMYHGKCWTATMRGKDDGTVCRNASEVIKHPENWDYIEIEIENWQYRDLVERMQIQVTLNKGYSKWDIFKFISPIHFPDDDRYICSEFANNMLVKIKVILKLGIVLPSTVAKKLTKKGLKIHSLT